LKFRRQRRDELAINLTPLIDVVFLLLIFFMVSTTFTSETQLSIDLPEAQGEPAAANPTRIQLTIDAAGVFRINGNEIDSEPRSLRKALRNAAGDRRDLPLTIAADGAAAHRHVVTALDAATTLGFERLTIAAEEPASQASDGDDHSG